jgi:adenine-specific DNA-methyltransferase
METDVVGQLALADASHLAGVQYLAKRTVAERKAFGQYFTPPGVARFMARQLGSIKNSSRILDPAVGSGTLLCAVIEQLIVVGEPVSVTLVGYEVDAVLCELAESTLADAARNAAEHGIEVVWCIRNVDFVSESLSRMRPSLFDLPHQEDHGSYSHIIANPPYFKLDATDERVRAAKEQIAGYTNIYTLFMALGWQSLMRDGLACFIVPRSFASGAYFETFRRMLLENVKFRHIHLFNSRQDTFSHDVILQENVILTMARIAPGDDIADGFPTDSIHISSSHSGHDLDESVPVVARASHIIQRRGSLLLLRLPTTPFQMRLIETLDCWSDSLSLLGFIVSTGPIVPFRTTENLSYDTNESEMFAPLLWMHHIQRRGLIFPLKENTRNKPQWVRMNTETESLLVANRNYVLLRRFSAKEEAHRLVAAPYLAGQIASSKLGFENHLNYIHHPERELETEEVSGLAALLNSTILDLYFRLVNGNTQVNATEIRSLPLPPLQVIKKIGVEVAASPENQETIVTRILLDCGLMDVALMAELKQDFS